MRTSSSARGARRGGAPGWRLAFVALALAFAGGCADSATVDAGGSVSSSMGFGPAPAPITPSMPGPVVTSIASFGGAGLVAPTRIALAPGDEIVVSDALGRSVHLFSLAGEQRGRITGFLRPLAVGAAADGRIYVGDAGDGSVRIVDRAGAALGAFGAGAGELAMPNDLSVDATTGEVFVTDSKRDQVRVFAADGTPARTLLSRGAEPGKVAFPTGVLVDPAGQLLVADHDNARIEVFSKDGVLQPPVIGGVLSSQAGGMKRPQGIARDARGRIYMADAYLGKVQVFDPNGASLGFIGGHETENGTVWLPSDVVIDRLGRLLVASYGTGRIVVFSLTEPDAPAAGLTASTRGPTAAGRAQP